MVNQIAPSVDYLEVEGDNFFELADYYNVEVFQVMGALPGTFVENYLPCK